MSTVLVAPLGDHPVVATAAMDALRRDGVVIDRVDLLCPDDSRIQLGEEWVELELGCRVQRHDLPFADANSETAAMQYLQKLAEVLLACEAQHDVVHLLLAGGRKNMSAMTAVLAQLFLCVDGLYHLLDVHEADPTRRNLFTVEELNAMANGERTKCMHPPAESVRFFGVPFPRVGRVPQIQRFLLDPDCSAMPPLPLSVEVEEFYGGVFQQRSLEEVFEVRLSQTALDQFDQMWRSDRNRAETFRKCFGQMRQPGRLKSDNGMHGTFGANGVTFHFYKRRRTPERPFYYTLPNPIHTYPKKEVHQVVVCGLSVERENQYEPSADDHLRKADREPHCPLSGLPSAPSDKPVILLAPLGETPMVATQAYALLRQFAEVSRVVLLYPSEHTAIANAASDLKSDFNREKVECDLRPIAGLSDVDSTQACQTYLEAVTATLSHVQRQDSEREIQLLLSGGRKSMAALNLFAAQRAGLPRVWHTLVRDPVTENRVAEELSRAASPSERRDVLFLRRHALDSFDLFPVPVFPMEGH